MIAEMSIKDILLLYKFRVWTLLIFTGIFSYLIATKAGYEFNLSTLIILFFAGSLSIWGNGALNNYLEVETDRIMKRTSNRPLVKNTISKEFALITGILFISLGIILALIFINILTAFFIFLASIIYYFYSAYLKRKTSLNVLIGGFAGNCTAWGGWAAAAGSLNLFAFLLGMLIYFWTNPHFWALALKYKDDYKRANLPMLTAIKDEKSSARIIAISSLPLPLTTALLAFIGNLSFYFIIFSLILNIVFISLATWLYLKPTEKNAWVLFKFSSPFLAIIFILIYVDPSEISFRI
jgi:protoheme IX farnesyltransferase